MKAIQVILLIVLLASLSFAAPVYYGGVSSPELKYSSHSTLGTNLMGSQVGSLRPIPKTYNTRRPIVSAPSSFNPNRNVIHSNATAQTWDYHGYCIEQEKSVQLRATKLSCSYQRQDRQLNTWSCSAGDYLRCVGTSCPVNTCRTQGVRVS